MSTTNDLATYAKLLRNAAPQQFIDFLGVFTGYTREKFKNLLLATTDRELVQGHAQQCQAILDILEKANDNG